MIKNGPLTIRQITRAQKTTEQRILDNYTGKQLS